MKDNKGYWDDDSNSSVPKNTDPGSEDTAAMPTDSKSFDAPAGEELSAIGTSDLQSSTTSMDAAAALDAFAPVKSVADTKKMSKKKRRIIIAVVLVVFLVIIPMIVGALKPAEKAKAQTTTVEQGTFEKTVEGKGNLEPYASSLASPEITGIVDQVLVGEGNQVNEGDALYTIKNDDLDSAVAQAQTTLTTALNTLSQARNTRQSLIDAQNTASSATTSAADTSATSTSSTSVSTTSSQSAAASIQTQIDNANLQISSAASAVDSAQQAYDSAVAKADKRTVRATMSGTVLTSNIVSGTSLSTLAQSGKPALQIADMSKMLVKIPVSEVDISQVQVGQTAKITFDALSGTTVSGTVTHIANASSSSSSSTSTTSSLTSSTQSVRYEVTLLISAPDAKMKSGMTAHASILTLTIPDSLMVSKTALTSKDGKYYVTKQGDDETTIEVEVQVISQTDSKAAIKGNLSQGDVLVIPSSSSTTN